MNKVMTVTVAGRYGEHFRSIGAAVGAFLFLCGVGAIIFGVPVAAAWVAVHFIAKYW